MRACLTFYQEQQLKYGFTRPYIARSTRELRNMRLALTLAPWLNGDEEKMRLADVTRELNFRSKRGTL